MEPSRRTNVGPGWTPPSLSPAAASYITGFALTRVGAEWTAPEVTGNIFAADNDPPTPTNLTTAIGDAVARPRGVPGVRRARAELARARLEPDQQQILRELIDETLPGHARVDDEFEGWTTESNVYWRESLFSEIEHGAEDVGELALDDLAGLLDLDAVFSHVHVLLGLLPITDRPGQRRRRRRTPSAAGWR
mgnify:CR=1 FL=1